MDKFGFKSLNRTVVVLGEESSLWQQLVEHQPILNGCIACGACTAVCPRSVSHKLSVRKALASVRNGMKLGMKPDDCIMCNKCALVCPRNLNTRLVWFSISNLENDK